MASQPRQPSMSVTHASPPTDTTTESHKDPSRAHLPELKRKPVPTATDTDTDTTNGHTRNTPSQSQSQYHQHAPRPSLTEQYRSLRFHISVLYTRLLPPQKRYFHNRASRRTIILLILLFFLLLIVAIVLGLALGLTQGRNRPVALPLGRETYSGDLTYYGVGLGACGVEARDRDMVVSISRIVFDEVGREGGSSAGTSGGNPNGNPLCGKKIRAVREGKGVELRVVDRCVGCQPTDIDVSPAAFAKLANPGLGRVPVTWAWLDPVPNVT